ncbi:hypothetical protein QUB50_01995 [Microcoleus sp. A6-C5]
MYDGAGFWLAPFFIGEGRRKKEEGRRKKEDGRRKTEEGRRKKIKL